MKWQLAKRKDDSGYISYMWVKLGAPLLLPAHGINDGLFQGLELRYITNVNHKGLPVVVAADRVELMPEFADEVKRVHYDLAMTLDIPQVLELRKEPTNV